MSDKSREEESPSIKINDRRQFTNEGDRRQEVDQKVSKSATDPRFAPQEEVSQEAPSFAQLPMAEGESLSQGAEHSGPIGFEHLVMYLATSAMYHMGLDPNASGESPNINLPAAKQTIDLLDILQQKTVGNLSDQEKRMVEGSLYELRMVFVEITKRGQGS